MCSDVFFTLETGFVTKKRFFFFSTFNPDKEDYWEAIKEIPYCGTDGFKKVLDLSDEHY